MKKGVGLRVFDGAVAIVTGGASGIGCALSKELAKRGATVIIADYQKELSEKIAAGICCMEAKAEAVHLDVRDYNAVDAVVDNVFDKYGRLDYMFNNAGIGIGGPTHLHTIDGWNRIIDINFKGVVNGIQAVYPRMLKQGFGHIVNTASAAGLVPTVGMSAYTATKFAVVALSKTLRIEAALEGIRVSALCPGVIRTNILQGGGVLGTIYGYNQNDIDKFFKLPLMRPMEPDAFAPKVIDQVAGNKSIIVVPSWWKILWWQHRLMPVPVQEAIDRALYGLFMKLHK